MLNVEIIKFEAQDVITASGVCDHAAGTTWKLVITGGQPPHYDATCNDCGATGSGTEVVNGKPVIKWN